MSKEVYSIENQEKFNVAMVVGHVTSLRGETQHKEEIADWTYDIELANLALAIYNRVKDKGFSNEARAFIKKNIKICIYFYNSYYKFPNI